MKQLIVSILSAFLLCCGVSSARDVDDIKQLRSLAESGKAEAQYYLAFRYSKGDGVARNINEAMRWYRLSAAQGYAAAQHALGIIFNNGEGGVTRDYREAMKWYRLAADKGYALAQTNLGGMYGQGHGVEQNYNDAL